MFELLLPELSFVELCFQWFTRREVRKTPHEEKRVGLIDAGKRPKVFSSRSRCVPGYSWSEIYPGTVRAPGLVVYVLISTIMNTLHPYPRAAKLGWARTRTSLHYLPVWHSARYSIECNWRANRAFCLYWLGRGRGGPTNCVVVGASPMVGVFRDFLL
jgi:hypothetical protein